ncbi:MAG: hypothetical protein CMJ76_03620 [Planctomycetaceae bacterium]|nr:hypothetical protein [Planctomycetaceae bacterium]|tara:strand:- start:765 stop:1232 length:468 start_codon:yes stop_codon:yes gene_type:complete
MQRFVTSSIFCIPLLILSGCQTNVEQSDAGTLDGDVKVAVVSLTSDPLTDPQAVNMGLTFAGFCLDEGYAVAIFFNVKGVTLPTTSFDADYKYQQHAPMIEQLRTLKNRGAELHVCPVCMKDLNITAEDIIEDAFVTDKPRLFGKLGSDTMVFTY